jgi:hypothetical protein
LATLPISSSLLHQGQSDGVHEDRNILGKAFAQEGGIQQIGTFTWLPKDDTVLHLLETLTPEAAQRQVINAKLALLKKRLQDTEQRL